MKNENSALELKNKTRKVIGFQVVAGIIVAAIFYSLYTPWHGYSVLYGTMINVVSSWWLSHVVSKASDRVNQGRSGEAVLYVGAALRFIMVLAFLAIGLAVIKLDAVATVVGFVLAQFAFIIAGNMRGHRD